jgi:ATP-dependent DNA helicase RecG
MYYTKDIESFGTGLKRITDACDDAGVKVEFQLLKKGFAVVLKRPDENFGMIDKISGEVVNEVVNRKEAIKSAMRANPNITIKQIAEKTASSRVTVEREIQEMKKANNIKRVGSDKAGHWEVVD